MIRLQIYTHFVAFILVFVKILPDRYTLTWQKLNNKVFWKFRAHCANWHFDNKDFKYKAHTLQQWRCKKWESHSAFEVTWKCKLRELAKGMAEHLKGICLLVGLISLLFAVCMWMSVFLSWKEMWRMAIMQRGKVCAHWKLNIISAPDWYEISITNKWIFTVSASLYAPFLLLLQSFLPKQ